MESNWIILPKTPKDGEEDPESSVFSPVFVSSNVNVGFQLPVKLKLKFQLLFSPGSCYCR